MTNKPTPTDAEILALAVETGMRVVTGKGAVRYARAVLAKWGTPAPVGVEPLIPFRHGCKWCGKTTGCKHTQQPAPDGESDGFMEAVNELDALYEVQPAPATQQAVDAARKKE